MLDRAILTLTLLTTIGSGLVAGVFLAFSSVIMRALARLPAPQGIAAMQSINSTVLTSSFLAALFLTAVGATVIGIAALTSFDRPGSLFVVAGSAMLLVGVMVVTGVFNVPRNVALAAVDPIGAEGAATWGQYLSTWTAWNHVRTAASIGSTAAFVIALVLRRGA